MTEKKSIQYHPEKERLNLKPILLLAGIAFVFNIGLSLTNYYDYNFDSWAHMFFSSHYMNSWFDTWEPRWFTGFSVTSYPPLVTQLLALLGHVFGLENAYVLLSLVGMVLTPVSVYFFCRNFISDEKAAWAGFIAISLPSIYLTNYLWGQLPCLLALVTSLFMGFFFGRFLEQGRFRHALIAALLVGVTAASHHVTFICLIPVIVLVTLLTQLYLARRDLKTVLWRTVTFASLSLPLVVFPIFPFWKFAFTTNVQTEIAHITRTNLFSDGIVFLQWVLAPYFLLILMIPLVPLVAIRHRHLIPLVIVVIILFVLGLGGSTPLPHLVFGEWGKWLTFERFPLWSSVLLLPLAVTLLPLGDIRLSNLSIRAFLSLQKGLLLVAVFVMCLASAYLGSEPLRKTLSPSHPQIDVKAPAEFLDRPEIGSQYYYITLGFGEAQFQKLSTLTEARSLDGTYYTARTLPVLRESGIASIDASKYFDPELQTLGAILKDAPNYHLKWVLVNDVYYYEILNENDFTLRWSAESMLDSRLAGVTIWERNDIPTITGENRNETGFWSYVWGIAPLSLLATLFVVLLVEIRFVFPKK